MKPIDLGEQAIDLIPYDSRVVLVIRRVITDVATGRPTTVIDGSAVLDAAQASALANGLLTMTGG